MMKKVERQPAISLPPSWCSRICKNSMLDVCVEDCAIKRDCSWFEPKRDLTVYDLKRISLADTHEMSKEEKFTTVIVYLSKVVEHLQGAENERPDFNYPRSRKVPKAVQAEGTQLGPVMKP